MRGGTGQIAQSNICRWRVYLPLYKITRHNLAWDDPILTQTKQTQIKFCVALHETQSALPAQLFQTSITIKGSKKL